MVLTQSTEKTTLSPETTTTSDSLLRFITCGSVDDGKSTLIGRLLYETEQIFDNELAQLKNGEAIDFANLVDGLESEREQGITIDVAYRYFRSSKRKFIVADTPGHQQYTRNMATGASHAELAIIMVDASKGLLPQSKRHSIIVSLMGVKQVIVCINKMDLVDYSQTIFNQICNSYRAFSEKLSLESITFLPASALSGDSITEPSQSMSWYQGPTLLQLLDSAPNALETKQEGVCLPVQWVNRANASFRGYAGTISQGHLKEGQAIQVLPSKHQATVTAIYNGDKKVSNAKTGDAVTVTLNDEFDISRGDVLCAADSPLQTANQLQASLLWMSEKPLVTGRQYLMQVGTKSVIATPFKLKHGVDIHDLSEIAKSDLQLNEIGVCELALSETVAFQPYQDNPNLGGFILIDKLSHQTVAAGFIDFALRRANNIHYQTSAVSSEERQAIKGHKPGVLWFTGLSGAGKSTIASKLELMLNQQGIHTALLDGDNVRFGLNKDLGFKAADRVENIRRIAEVSKLMCEAGLITLVSFISPFKAEREMAKQLVGEDKFIEVHVDVPLSVAESRDVKGLYQKARAGEIKHFTGIDSPYESPNSPDLVIKTDEEAVDEACQRIYALLVQRQLIGG